MLQHRFVRVVPLLSKKKHLEEFVISEDYFLQDFHYKKNNDGCELVADNSLPHSACSKEDTFESSEFIDKVDNISKKISESLLGNEKCNMKITSAVSECCSIVPAFCCFAKREKKPMNICYFLKMDGQILSFIAMELSRSPFYRKAVIDRLFEQYSKRENACKVEKTKCTLCGCIWKSITVGIYLMWPYHCIMDKVWNLKIRMFINERCEIENAMSWLSTLGGAYSSLGDEFLYHAKQAEQVSLQQYKLALRLQDPLAVSRCKIFFAMSLVQQGYYKEAKQIIRKQYKYAITEEGRLDFRLANMCKAVWNKIKYLQSEQ